MGAGGVNVVHLRNLGARCCCVVAARVRLKCGEEAKEMSMGGRRAGGVWLWLVGGGLLFADCGGAMYCCGDGTERYTGVELWLGKKVAIGAALYRQGPGCHIAKHVITRPAKMQKVRERRKSGREASSIPKHHSTGSDFPALARDGMLATLIRRPSCDHCARVSTSTPSAHEV